MVKHLTLRLSAFFLLATAGTTANACFLLPFLNPFAWTCGYGCGYGHGYGTPGLFGARPWCCPLLGCRGYGYGYGIGSSGWHHGWHGPSYSPSYPSVAPNPCCESLPGSVTPPIVPDTAQTSWPGAVSNSQTALWGSAGGWRPQYQWSPPGTSWQPFPQQYSMTAPTYAAPQNMMSTAPTWYPTSNGIGYTPQTAARVPGDIGGDHELPVIPNSFHPATGAPFQPTGYPLRTVRRYSGVVR